MIMDRFEWIAVLRKAKKLAEGRNDICFCMFGFLLDAMETTPVVIKSRCNEEGPTEEDEE